MNSCTDKNTLDGTLIIKPNELKRYIRRLQNKKSPGDDKINNRIIKHLPHKAIVFLTIIYNSCIRMSYFPNQWKIARVIPVYKPGKDRSILNSYRPISLLSQIGKLFEKCIHKRITEYVITKDILPKQQFGFRTEHSTVHQLKRLSNTICNNIKNKLSTGMVLFDIEKAFDRVWHDGLIYKMIKLKFPSYLIKLTRSFISNRFFYVSIAEETSTLRPLINGVPQGAVLSPILYNIFTSDIQCIFREDTEYALYADDTSLYTSSACPDTIVEILQNNIDQLVEYCDKWNIKLNDNKTQAIFFTRRRASRYLPSDNILKINNSRLTWQENIKYLGITFDKKLTFKNHIEVIIEKAQLVIKVLYSLINRKSKLSCKNKLLIYTLIIRPTILYGFPAWSHCAISHRKKLQIIQNKCLKIIYGKPRYYSTRRLHNKSNVPLIDDFASHLNNLFLISCRLHTNSLISGIHNI